MDRQRIATLRASQEGVQPLPGQLTETVIVRQQHTREATDSLRRLAAVVRARFGFNNPAIESFNIRSEHRAKRGRKPKAKPAAASNLISQGALCAPSRGAPTDCKHGTPDDRSRSSRKS